MPVPEGERAFESSPERVQTSGWMEPEQAKEELPSAPGWQVQPSPKLGESPLPLHPWGANQLPSYKLFAKENLSSVTGCISFAGVLV